MKTLRMHNATLLCPNHLKSHVVIADDGPKHLLPTENPSRQKIHHHVPDLHIPLYPILIQGNWQEMKLSHANEGTKLNC
jgi:hypothetical protein